jgi:hypothetical protein
LWALIPPTPLYLALIVTLPTTRSDTIVYLGLHAWLRLLPVSPGPLPIRHSHSCSSPHRSPIKISSIWIIVNIWSCREG